MAHRAPTTHPIETFKITARETRGGWRGVAVMHNGVVAVKTIPVFRDKQDAMDSIRGWLREHGAHADRRIGGSGGQMHHFTNSVLYETGWYYKPAGEKHWIGPYSTKARAATAMRSGHADRRIPYRERKLIPRKFFALPERAPGRGALPLADPQKGWRYSRRHIANAAARLAQMIKRGSVTPAEIREAEKNIMAGACATGVERTCQRLLAKYETRPATRMAAYSR